MSPKPSLLVVAPVAPATPQPNCPTNNRLLVDLVPNSTGNAPRERAAYEPGGNHCPELDYWTTAEVFNQARKLALVIMPIPELANQIAYEAMLAAHVCHNKQYRHRQSWLKQQRYKKFGPTKALLHQHQLVQRFVYREAEKYERYSEGDTSQVIDNPEIAELLAHTPLTPADLVVRYLKYLVQLAEDNSANTVLAVTKLIYRYRTIDVAELYTQLHGDGPADNYFSKRKGEFFKRLEERFCALIEQGVLTVGTNNRRERYFHGQEQPNARWQTLVTETFQHFTPWGTTCTVTTAPHSFVDNLWQWLERLFNEDQRKLSRIHTLLCPACFQKLVQDLNLASPTECLTLPQFHWPEEGVSTMWRTDEQRSPDQERAEIKQVLNRLKHETYRRSRLAPSNTTQLNLVIDDRPVGTLNLNGAHSNTIELPAPNRSQLLKVYTHDYEGRLLLATIWLHPTELASLLPGDLGAKEFSLLHESDNIVLKIKYCVGEAEETGSYQINLIKKVGLLDHTMLFWHEYSLIMESVWLK